MLSAIMVKESALRLQWLCENIQPLLTQISNEEFNGFRGEGKWTRKQILGHLIDSAANNHQRFIRAQFEPSPVIVYEQDSWNRFGHYSEMNAELLITTWVAINLFLAELIQHISPSAYGNLISMGNENHVTLAFIIEDYVTHLEHHLKQIVNY
jgi:hypothetical protein